MSTESRQLWSHYGIASDFPTQWPAGKDESDNELPSEPSVRAGLRKGSQRKSRFSVLERGWTDRRPAVPGAETTRDGMETLVQKDEADALGIQGSVVKELRSKGVNVDGNIRERNQFLLSSTTFIPGVYLSQIHDNASTDDLYAGLRYLTQSIDQKSASLRDLVESNFERFVRAKSVIDNVYTTMRNQGGDVDEKPKTHSRHQSRTSLHWRNTSGQGMPAMRGVSGVPTERKKHALTKESEYGVYGIKVPLNEIAVKAEEIWGPAMGDRDRENNLKSILDSIDNSEGIMDLGRDISAAIKRKEFDDLVKHYTKALQHVASAKETIERASKSRSVLTDTQVHRVVMTGRMWTDVELQIDNFKRGIWRDLTSVQANLTMSTDRSHQNDHVALISVLLELGVDDNPIWVWLLSRYDYLKNKINVTFERSRMEIEIYRRRLASAEKPSLHSSAAHFKSPSRKNSEDYIKHLDTPLILEFWELIVHAMTNLLSLHGGILGEIMDFWDRTQSYIDGKAQRTLPMGINGVSRKHHTIDMESIKDLQSGVIELVDSLREHILSFFIDPPIEDVSAILSPAFSEAPGTPKTPRSAMLSPFSMPDQRFNVDLLTPVPPTPKLGEPWESFAFWPPWANSLSGVHFLGRLIHLLAAASSEMTSIPPIANMSSSVEKLKTLLNAVRERSAKAVCTAWSNDVQNIKVLEDWTRSPESKDMTRMPIYFSAFEGYILSGLQKILYVSDAVAPSSRKNQINIITPPPNKLLQMARSQFVNSLYKALSGIVENTKSPSNATATESENESVFSLQSLARTSVLAGDAVDSSTLSLRMLHTLSNLTLLRSTILPNLITQFETDFSIALPEEKKMVADALAQIDTQLFQSYIRPHSDFVNQSIATAVASPEWTPQQKPHSVKPYVYNVLLHLVGLHTELSTTAEPLVHPVLSSLFETICKALLEAFRARASSATSTRPFDLFCLMQATLDVEFFARTLAGTFGSERASETQAQVYIELDRTGDARALQKELPEMRAILKRLAESTRSQFACFKKDRREKDGKRDTNDRASSRSGTPATGR